MVTGASAGIGVGIAECLARAGFGRLTLVARRREKLEEVASACRAAGAKEVLVLPKDMGKLESCAEVVRETVDKFGSEEEEGLCLAIVINSHVNLIPGLDVLVNCAGIVHAERAIDTKTEDFQRIINFNLTMPFVLAREALPHLRKVKGNIIFISSDSGEETGPSCFLLNSCCSCKCNGCCS